MPLKIASAAAAWYSFYMSYFAYILRCNDDTLYCGYTDDPARRLAVHNSGRGAKYTRARLPVELVYTEEFETKNEAMSREFRLKQLTRAQKEALVYGKSEG